MQFSCTQENLAQGLSVVSHIAGKNINLPILGNVLVRCDDKVLHLLATNLEIAVSCTVRGKIDEPGEFTIPSRLFSDYVNLLPKDRVDVIGDGNAVTVACGSYKTKINGIAASEFPLIPTIERKKKFSVKLADFRRAVAQVLFAAAPNESRPEISGILFKFVPVDGGHDLVLAATDSYRLAERVVATVSSEHGRSDETESLIVPGRTVAEFVRILGVFKDAIDSPDSVDIYCADGQVLFAFTSVEVVSRTIEGRYPDYRQLIPERHETEIVVEKEELTRAVKATSLFSRTGLNDVVLSFSPGGMVSIAASNMSTGEQMVELQGEVTGKENKVTVNYKYLLDGVGNIEGDKVRIQVIDGVNPCIVRPYSASHDYLYIVMPIRQ
jgi:DNA polymerase-3 subunit beta